MTKKLLERLNEILDWWKIEDFTDRKEIEKELTLLLNDAYDIGYDTGYEDGNDLKIWRD